jgi:hypothetical protein
MSVKRSKVDMRSGALLTQNLLSVSSMSGVNTPPKALFLSPDGKIGVA